MKITGVGAYWKRGRILFLNPANPWTQWLYDRRAQWDNKDAPKMGYRIGPVGG